MQTKEERSESLIERPCRSNLWLRTRILRLAFVLILPASIYKIGGHCRITTEVQMNVARQGIVEHETICPDFDSLATAQLEKVGNFPGIPD